MSDLNGLQELIERLTLSGRLSSAQANHLVEEVLAYLDESVQQFVARRHQELQREGLSNPGIYERIAREAQTRRFRAPALSDRQIRRLIYG